MVRTYLPPVGRAHLGKHAATSPVLGPPASLIRSEFPTTQGSGLFHALSRPDAPTCIQHRKCRHEVLF
jgi:hypothetical protein